MRIHAWPGRSDGDTGKPEEGQLVGKGSHFPKQCVSYAKLKKKELGTLQVWGSQGYTVRHCERGEGRGRGKESGQKAVLVSVCPPVPSYSKHSHCTSRQSMCHPSPPGASVGALLCSTPAYSPLVHLQQERIVETILQSSFDNTWQAPMLMGSEFILQSKTNENPANSLTKLGSFHQIKTSYQGTNLAREEFSRLLNIAAPRCTEASLQ